MEDRFRVAFIALLTVVATHTVISRSLPRLSYPTIADMSLIVCYLTASALIFTATVVRKMHERGQVERAKKLDPWMRWLLPIIAAAILTVAVTALWG